jgi:hypothetical protein
MLMFWSSACLTYLSTLKMEVITFFETSISQFTRFSIPEDDILNIYHYEYIKDLLCDLVIRVPD